MADTTAPLSLCILRLLVSGAGFEPLLMLLLTPTLGRPSATTSRTPRCLRDTATYSVSKMRDMAPVVEDAIQKNLNNCVTTTSLGLPGKHYVVRRNTGTFIIQFEFYLRTKR